MNGEERKFLDLDQVCEQILSDEDRAMFNEAIRCYSVGSHRAAVILAWCVTADCLRRRIDELALEGDGVAQQAQTELGAVEGQAVYEENLIAQAKKCDLFDDYEEKCLRFARDTRSKCAHPTGVVPAAETVRHILHGCSQIVLCREGYRGMSFIKSFLQTRLADRHLFPDANRIPDVCRNYYSRVPDRLKPQFAACSLDAFRQNKTAVWRENWLHFVREMLRDSDASQASRIVAKLQPFEAEDMQQYAVLVGIDGRADELWDEQVRNRARAHLRDALKLGIPDAFVFSSWANLCVYELDADDKALLEDRLAVIADLLSQHDGVLRAKRETVLDLLLTCIQNGLTREPSLRACTALLSSELCSVENGQTAELIEEFIKSDWTDEPVRAILQATNEWTDALLVSLLRKTEDYLLECTEQQPDDVLVLFEAASTLLKRNPTLLPSEFESGISKFAKREVSFEWSDKDSETWISFTGQIDLIRSRYGSELPLLLALQLDDPEEEEDSGEET